MWKSLLELPPTPNASPSDSTSSGKSVGRAGAANTPDSAVSAPSILTLQLHRRYLPYSSRTQHKHSAHHCSAHSPQAATGSELLQVEKLSCCNHVVPRKLTNCLLGSPGTPATLLPPHPGSHGCLCLSSEILKNAGFSGKQNYLNSKCASKLAASTVCLSEAE